MENGERGRGEAFAGVAIKRKLILSDQIYGFVLGIQGKEPCLTKCIV